MTRAARPDPDSSPGRSDRAEAPTDVDGHGNRPVSHLVVDGMNVIGSTPDGWWRDRDGAARRLLERLQVLARRPGPAVTLVLDGRPIPGMPEGHQPGGVTVAYARRPGSRRRRRPPGRGRRGAGASRRHPGRHVGSCPRGAGHAAGRLGRRRDGAAATARPARRVVGVAATDRSHRSARLGPTGSTAAAEVGASTPVLSARLSGANDVVHPGRHTATTRHHDHAESTGTHERDGLRRHDPAPGGARSHQRRQRLPCRRPHGCRPRLLLRRRPGRGRCRAQRRRVAAHEHRPTRPPGARRRHPVDARDASAGHRRGQRRRHRRRVLPRRGRRPAHRRRHRLLPGRRASTTD